MSESQSASGLSCSGGHLFVWAGTPGAMPDGWPCVCGATRWESQASEIARLEAEVATLRATLEDLLDVQNGPPLVEYTDAWNEAMEQARVALIDNITVDVSEEVR